MAIYRALKAILLTLTTFQIANGYILDSACASHVGEITDGVNEALAIAEYAAWRIENDPESMNGFRKQMLGDNQNAVDQFNWRMKGLPDVVGPLYAGVFYSAQDRDKDSNILFRCGDSKAKKAENVKKDRWYDVDFPNRFPLMRYADKSGKKPIPVCAKDVRAMTADTQQPDANANEAMPHHIIYLCDAAFTRPSVMGKDWQKMWTGKGVEKTARFLSGTILHELLHAQKPELLGKLPSGSGEQYKYEKIVALSDEDKVANAHGHTLLATASWLKGFEIGTDGTMGKDLTPDQQPGKSPNDGHP